MQWSFVDADFGDCYEASVTDWILFVKGNKNLGQTRYVWGIHRRGSQHNIVGMSPESDLKIAMVKAEELLELYHELPFR